jgi:hypothetical protein
MHLCHQALSIVNKADMIVQGLNFDESDLHLILLFWTVVVRRFMNVVFHLTIYVTHS